MNIEDYKLMVEETLLKEVKLGVVEENEPVQVFYTPKGWECIGTGNYAAVFTSEKKRDWVVKIYARQAEKLKEEANVYKKIGKHPKYAELMAEGVGYLILTRLEGITLYDALIKGIRIPKKVVNDVNEALEHAKQKGLNPNDVHAKNIIMKEGSGYVIDVAEFDKEESDTKWCDFRKFYDSFYQYTLSIFPIQVPEDVMDLTRKGYRFYQKLKKL